MIHKVLNLTRKLVVLDTETTGVNPAEARIVEIGLQVWTAEGLTKEWKTFINPGVLIPEDAGRVHGISNEDVAGSQPFSYYAENLAKGLVDCDFAGKNVRFDLRVLAAEMQRAKVEWSYMNACIIDADRLEQLGEPRSLSHLYQKHLGRELDGAHSALADVKATTEVIEAQLLRYENLPRSVGELHALQWPNVNIDMDGKFQFVKGVATCMFGKWRNKPMSDIEPSYWDWILSKDFSPDIRALASKAKMGQFPKMEKS